MPALILSQLSFLLKKRSENRREIERQLGKIQETPPPLKNQNQRRFCGGAGALRKVQEMEGRIGIVKGQLRPQSALLAEPAEFGCSFSFLF